MRVLIVDDEPIIRLALRRALETRQHTVFEAENGGDGLSIWKSQNPDLVFLDVLMPGQSGLQVLEEVGNSNKSIVLLMSAYSGIHGAHDMKQTEAHGFLKKPFEDIFEIIQIGERLVHERRNS